MRLAERRLPSLPSADEIRGRVRVDSDNAAPRADLRLAPGMEMRPVIDVVATLNVRRGQAPPLTSDVFSPTSANFTSLQFASSPQRRALDPPRLEGANSVSTRQHGTMQGSASRAMLPPRRHVQDTSSVARLPPREQLAQRRLERQRASSVPLLSASDSSGLGGRGHRLGQAAFLALGFAPQW